MISDIRFFLFLALLVFRASQSEAVVQGMQQYKTNTIIKYIHPTEKKELG